MKSMRVLPKVSPAVMFEPLKSACLKLAPAKLTVPNPMNSASSKTPYDMLYPLMSSSLSYPPSVTPLHLIGQLLSPAGRAFSISRVHGGAGGEGGGPGALIALPRRVMVRKSSIWHERTTPPTKARCFGTPSATSKAKLSQHPRLFKSLVSATLTFARDALWERRCGTISRRRCLCAKLRSRAFGDSKHAARSTACNERITLAGDCSERYPWHRARLTPRRRGRLPRRGRPDAAACGGRARHTTNRRAVTAASRERRHGGRPRPHAADARCAVVQRRAGRRAAGGARLAVRSRQRWAYRSARGRSVWA